MTWKVTFVPSGREIMVEPDETILEAALRDGLSVNYHCNNGSCGECQARVIEGQYRSTSHSDFFFSEADKRRSMILTCSTAPESDMVIGAVEAKSVEDIPLQNITAQAVKLEPVTDDVAILHVRTPRSRTLRFLAGQYVNLQFNGQPAVPKPIASCPCNGLQLQFHVHRTEENGFSDYVFNTMQSREPVQINGPFGNFVLDGDDGRPIVFITYETGFAPIKSLIEHAISLEYSKPIYLYWVARNNGFYMENHCRAWQDALDAFHYRLICIDSDSSRNSKDLTGQDVINQIINAVLRKTPDLGKCSVYVNGPESEHAALREVLLASNANEKQLHLSSMLSK